MRFELNVFEARLEEWDVEFMDFMQSSFPKLEQMKYIVGLFFGNIKEKVLLFVKKLGLGKSLNSPTDDDIAIYV